MLTVGSPSIIEVAAVNKLELKVVVLVVGVDTGHRLVSGTCYCSVAVCRSSGRCNMDPL